jgi:hypothetical protein
MTRTAGGGRDVGTVGRMLKARRDRLSWGSASVLWHICRRLCDVSTGTGVCRASPYGRRAQERGCRASSTSFTPVSTPQQLGLVHSRSLFTQTLCHRRARRLHHRRVQCMGSAVHIALSKLSIRGHTHSLSRDPCPFSPSFRPSVSLDSTCSSCPRSSRIRVHVRAVVVVSGVRTIFEMFEG